ncbi:MAG: DUF433 domain-containing protein [Gammaproteobacteria bacterium]|nr:DUF433 domain-containing protein [Gammaproteobacteria bacterium]
MRQTDRRELPAYSLAEAAHYLAIPASTIRYWAAGRPGGSGAVVKAALQQPLTLSFSNLVELHVLGTLRRHFKISLPKVRTAIDYLRQRLDHPRPLISAQFETDGISLFVEHYGRLLNVTQEGQVTMRELLAASLRRVERDHHGLPIRLFPYTRSAIANAPRLIVIDPRLGFGRPVIAGTGLVTEEIAARYKAGESVAELARDYGRPEKEIDEAVRCELQAA